MSKIKFQTELGPIEFDSAEEAAAFYRAVRSGSEEKRAPTPHVARRKPVHRRSVRNPLKPDLAGKLVRALVEAGRDGVMASTLSTKIGLKGPKALSIVMGPLEERLSKIGLRFQDAIVKERIRTTDGIFMVWKATAKLRDAADRFEEGSV